ncbi:MAG: hypothetical protein ACFFCW_09410 [Candidatus Hodarchaeota archaeon]
MAKNVYFYVLMILRGIVRKTGYGSEADLKFMIDDLHDSPRIAGDLT